MWEAQIVEAGGIQLPDDPAVDRLGGNAQQSANQHILRIDRKALRRRHH
jgi:hypothetical protein